MILDFNSDVEVTYDLLFPVVRLNILLIYYKKYPKNTKYV